MRRRALRFRYLLAGLALATGAAQSPFQKPSLEYQVKAAFLLNFTKFVEWPGYAFPDPSTPISICVEGDAPIMPALEQMVQGETVNARPLMVRKRPAEPTRTCHILFVSRSEGAVAEHLAEAGRAVLTVGEDPAFLAEGGMIDFVIENRRVRFDINQKAVGNSALKFSSKLLNVARKVEK